MFPPGQLPPDPILTLCQTKSVFRPESAIQALTALATTGHFTGTNESGIMSNVEFR